MLTNTQTDEPPQTGYGIANSSAVPASTLTHNLLYPRHYLAIEGHRLFPFTISARPLFEEYARFMTVPLSDYTFANNFIWHTQKNGFYQIIEDCFCLFSLIGHTLIMPLPPLGAPEKLMAAVDTCFTIMNGYNPSPMQSRIEFVSRDLITAPLPDPARYLVERSLPDYIYRTADLIDLQGNAYKTKRSEINQFRRTYPNHRMETLNANHHEGIRALVNTWLKNRLQYLTGQDIADFFHTVEQERQAIERALNHYDTLGLTGLVILIDDRLEGFTFGERITPDVGNVLVEKTNFAIPGSAQYLFREFAKTFTDCTYLNVGDDLGLENLRRVKMSYRPALFGEKVALQQAPVYV